MQVFALCDANNFYCSCERVFQPQLRGVPLVVLSNNDGCCIARSQEAKDLGVKMGDPWFKIEKWAVEKGVRRFSSNYVLYGDMSRRLYEVLQRFSPYVEPYSIDEMFLDFEGLGDDLVAHGRRVRAAVLQETKIPTCVGIGETRTKAKLANFLAKKRPQFGGVAISATRLSALFFIRLSRSMKCGASAPPRRRSCRRSVDEILFGYEVVEEMPRIVKEWVELYKQGAAEDHG